MANKIQSPSRQLLLIVFLGGLICGMLMLQAIWQAAISWGLWRR